MVEATTAAAFISTTLISLAPNVLLFLFPSFSKLDADGSDGNRMNPLVIGQALAAGGLLGDVFLHTLPHTVTHENGEAVGMAVLAGFVTFLLFDMLVRSYGHDHDHHKHEHQHEDDKCSKNDKNDKFVISSAVVLNLAADSLHNFTDGIAIGASFAATSTTTTAGEMDFASLSFLSQIKSLLSSRGGMASLAVLFHEIPHELGDYSILVSAGMTKHQAILAQFSTAIAAYCGTFVGLFGAQTLKVFINNGDDTDLMVPFTAGGFVYLAAVTILPALLDESQKGPGGSMHTTKGKVNMVTAFLAGIWFMHVVALLEHSGPCCAHGHDHSHGHGVVLNNASTGGKHEHGHHHHHHGHDRSHSHADDAASTAAVHTVDLNEHDHRDLPEAHHHNDKHEENDHVGVDEHQHEHEHMHAHEHEEEHHHEHEHEEEPEHVHGPGCGCGGGGDDENEHEHHHFEL